MFGLGFAMMISISSNSKSNFIWAGLSLRSRLGSARFLRQKLSQSSDGARSCKRLSLNTVAEGWICRSVRGDAKSSSIKVEFRLKYHLREGRRPSRALAILSNSSF